METLRKNSITIPNPRQWSRPTEGTKPRQEKYMKILMPHRPTIPSISLSPFCLLPARNHKKDSISLWKSTVPGRRSMGDPQGPSSSFWMGLPNGRTRSSQPGGHPHPHAARKFPNSGNWRKKKCSVGLGGWRRTAACLRGHLAILNFE